MKIETKYKVYDTVWFMMNNIPVNRSIKAMTININDNGIKINYMIENVMVEESKVFATKEDLIKSL